MTAGHCGLDQLELLYEQAGWNEDFMSVLGAVGSASGRPNRQGVVRRRDNCRLYGVRSTGVHIDRQDWCWVRKLTAGWSASVSLSQQVTGKFHYVVLE